MSQLVFDFKKLKKTREWLGLTQAELAKKAGVTPAAICQIENGDRSPSIETMIKILGVIPIKFENLLGSK